MGYVTRSILQHTDAKHTESEDAPFASHGGDYLEVAPGEENHE